MKNIRHPEFHIINDLVIKKLMKDPMILESILQKLLKMKDLKLKSKLDPFQIRTTTTDTVIGDKKFYNTILDLYVECDNNVKAIIEFQRLKQIDYFKRINVYSSHEISSDFNLIKARYKDKSTHDLYGYSNPVYVITITEANLFDDAEPYHYATMSLQGESKQSLDVKLSETEEIVPRDLNVFLELGKYKKDMEHPFKDLMELFNNVPYTVEMNPILERAEEILDMTKWTEEEKSMNLYEEAARASYYSGIAMSKEEGIFEEKVQTAINLFSEKLSIDFIQKITGLSLEKLTEIKNQMAPNE